MHRLTLIATSLVALLAAAPAHAIDTIDCHTDRNPAERTICASNRLQVLDARVAEAYSDIMLDGSVKGSVKNDVYLSQREFLRRRDACGRDTDCLADEMQRRMARINLYR